MTIRIGLLLLASLMAGCNDSNDHKAPAPTPVANITVEAVENNLTTGSGFDFYVLSLSWSPHYCAEKGKNRDAQQCGAAKPFGFIVHGLWPQFERGYPQYCDAHSEPSRGEIQTILDLTPSGGLVRHEWEKHGSCSGLSPADYFKVMRAARGRVVVPTQFTNTVRAFSLSANDIENAFVRANKGLTVQAIAVDCERKKLAEVRICLTTALKFRSCPEVDRAGCRMQSVLIDPLK